MEAWKAQLKGVARSFALLVRVMSPIRALMAAGLALLVLGTFSQLAQPAITGVVMENFDDAVRLRESIVLLVATIVVAIVCNAIGTYCILRATENVVAGIRRNAVRSILSFPVSAYRKYNPGDLMSRVTADAGMVRAVASTAATQFLLGTISVVGALIMMWRLDSFLLLVTLCAIYPVSTLLLVTTPRVKAWAKRTAGATGQLSKALERAFGNPLTVKANTAELQESASIERRVDDVLSMGTKSGVWRAASHSVSSLMIQTGYVAVLAIGGIMVVRGNLEVSVLIPFLMYATQMSAPLVSMTQAFNTLQVGGASLERIVELEGVPSERGSGTPVVVNGPLERHGVDEAVSWNPSADFSAVDFAYPETEGLALADFTVTLPPSGLFAFVGPSGCGKSTVLRLLAGFYEPDEGMLRVGGVSLPEWDVSALRQNVAFVEQESPVLEGSFRRNLMYGNDDPTIDDDAIFEVLRRVQLGSRVPDLDADVGYRGSTMSGGERQRLSVARALLRNPKILLLDEATSALDNTTEGELMVEIERISRECCVIMVAHRMSTVRACDRIMVLEDGRLRAEGSHEQLMATDDIYMGLVRVQETKELVE